MIIGIDISQIVYEGTGVARYVKELTTKIVQKDKKNAFILFGASLRRYALLTAFASHLRRVNPQVRSVIVPIPPCILDILWNILHVVPITWFTGRLDIFWSSDWTQPPLGNVKGITTVHDLSFLKFPESFDKKILNVQRRRLSHAAKECRYFLCDSEATKRDMEALLGIDPSRLSVVYPGLPS